MKNKLWLGIICFLVCTGQFASPVLAGSIGVVPKALPEEGARSWFVYTLSPGAIKEDYVSIHNSGTKPITVVVEALDATNTTKGVFTLVKNVADNKDLGKWVKVSQPELTIPAGKTVDVKFTVSVPLDANVGEHSAGIAVYEKPSGANTGMSMKIRVGARMYVTVPGKVHRKITFLGVTHEVKDGKLVFNIKTRNDSNINLEPELEINMRGLLRTIKQTDRDISVYMPNSSFELTKTWNHIRPWLGYYRFQFVLHSMTGTETLEDGTVNQLPDEKFTYTLGMWVGTSWLLIFGGALLLTWLIFRFIVYFKDKKKFYARIQVYTVKAGEGLMHVAETTDVFPEVLIRFNQLPWPHALKAGDKLLIPAGVLTPDEIYRKQQTETLPSIFTYLFSFRTSLYHPIMKQTNTKLVSTKLIRKRRKKK